MPKPETEVWYMWKEYLLCPTVDENGKDIEAWRLVTPRADPHEYEFAIDFQFYTPEDAVKFLSDWGIEQEEYKDWVLCKETTEPVRELPSRGIE